VVVNVPGEVLLQIGVVPPVIVAESGAFTVIVEVLALTPH
jgi:hypothetical protein